MIVFRYDGVLFEKTEEGWVCRDFAMKGPRGSMLNKLVPTEYISPIEKAYSQSLISEEAPIKEIKKELPTKEDKPKEISRKTDSVSTDKKLKRLKQKVKNKQATKKERKGFNPFNK